MQKKRVLVDLDYVDPGLQTRIRDCENSLDSLDLRDGDAIVDIIENARRTTL